MPAEPDNNAAKLKISSLESRLAPSCVTEVNMSILPRTVKSIPT